MAARPPGEPSQPGDLAAPPTNGLRRVVPMAEVGLALRRPGGGDTDDVAGAEAARKWGGSRAAPSQTELRGVAEVVGGCNR